MTESKAFAQGRCKIGTMGVYLLPVHFPKSPARMQIVLLLILALQSIAHASPESQLFAPNPHPLALAAGLSAAKSSRCCADQDLGLEGALHPVADARQKNRTKGAGTPKIRHNQINPRCLRENRTEILCFHKYLYANANPVMLTDPSGQFSLIEISMVNNLRLEFGSSQLSMTGEYFLTGDVSENAAYAGIGFGVLVGFFGAAAQWSEQALVFIGRFSGKGRMTGEFVDIFRAVGPEEFYDILRKGEFAMKYGNENRFCPSLKVLWVLRGPAMTSRGPRAHQSSTTTPGQSVIQSSGCGFSMKRARLRRGATVHRSM